MAVPCIGLKFSESSIIIANIAWKRRRTRPKRSQCLLGVPLQLAFPVRVQVYENRSYEAQE